MDFTRSDDFSRRFWLRKAALCVRFINKSHMQTVTKVQNEQSDKNYRCAIAASLPLVRSLDLSGITRKDREDIHLLGKRRGGER